MQNTAMTMYYQAEVEYRREQLRQEWRPRARRRIRNQIEDGPSSTAA